MQTFEFIRDCKTMLGVFKLLVYINGSNCVHKFHIMSHEANQDANDDARSTMALKIQLQSLLAKGMCKANSGWQGASSSVLQYENHHLMKSNKPNHKNLLPTILNTQILYSLASNNYQDVTSTFKNPLVQRKGPCFMWLGAKVSSRKHPQPPYIKKKICQQAKLQCYFPLKASIVTTQWV